MERISDICHCENQMTEKFLREKSIRDIKEFNQLYLTIYVLCTELQLVVQKYLHNMFSC